MASAQSPVTAGTATLPPDEARIPGVQPITLDTHPDFASANTDVVLRSSDDVLFRVSSDMLCRTSGWLNTMFTLPQNPATDRTEPIPMGEPSDVLAKLLSVADGRSLPTLDSGVELEQLLAAAEKYDMPMVISVLRLAFSSRFSDVTPIRMYVIACRMGWEREAKDASTRTLTQDLLTPEVQAELAMLSRHHRDMLLDLHRRRREDFFAGLEDRTEFYANNRGCPCNMEEEDNDCTAPLDHSHWWALKYGLMQRWVTSPLGTELDETFYCMPEFVDMARAKCGRCDRLIYGPAPTIKKINIILSGLPLWVELTKLF